MRWMALSLGMTLLSPQAFRTSVDVVRVDVLPTQGGSPVSGLTAGDFELRDNGVVQQIDAFTREEVPLNVMLALDASASVNGEALTHLKQAAGGLIELLRAEDRASILTFSGTVHVLRTWSSDMQDLAAQIQTITGSGGTALHDASYAAMLLRGPAPARSLVLIFSDGDDSGSWLSGQSVIDATERTESVVYAVQIQTSDAPRFGYLIDLQSGVQVPFRGEAPAMRLTATFLDALATQTGGQLVRIRSTLGLREAFANILLEFRSRYVLSYTPRGVSDTGWHTVQVTSRRPGIKVVARRGYLR